MTWFIQRADFDLDLTSSPAARSTAQMLATTPAMITKKPGKSFKIREQLELQWFAVTVNQAKNFCTIFDTFLISWRPDGHMVSALVSGSSDPGSSPGRGHCVVFLGKPLYSSSASLIQVYK